MSDLPESDDIVVSRSELEMIGRGLFALTEAVEALTAMMTEVHKAVTPDPDNLAK